MIRLRLFVIALALFLLGCGGPRSPQPAGGKPPAGSSGSTEDILVGLARYATYLAGLAILILGIALWLAPAKFKGKVLQGLAAAFCLLVTARVLGWVGAHLAFITICVVAAGLVLGLVVAYSRREYLIHKWEAFTGRDWDRDNIVGPPSKQQLKRAKEEAKQREEGLTPPADEPSEPTGDEQTSW